VGLLLLLFVMGLLVLWAALSSGFHKGAPPLTSTQRIILRQYALHYQRLSLQEQAHFEKKVSLFINEKTWIGAGIAVVEEMKVMIGACAAQLLQGFPDVDLMHFDRIVVYPDSYRSHRSGRLHQGEVRPKVGMIIISWDDFIHGYAHSRDAHNVGLHEMAHALWFENSIINGEDHFLAPDPLRRWNELAHVEIARIDRGEQRFFRDYAGANEAEYFAVAVEYFFELPKEYRSALPELYMTMAELLRQDPASKYPA